MERVSNDWQQHCGAGRHAYLLPLLDDTLVAEMQAVRRRQQVRIASLK